MSKGFRYFLFLISTAQFLFALAFFMQWPFVVNLWPFPGTTPLTYIFISSIFAAAALPTFWAAATENYGALSGIALDYLMILAPLAVYSLTLGASTGTSGISMFGIACLVGVVFGLALLLWSIRFSMDQTPPMPALVRWSFVVFIIALLYVGIRMVLQEPNVIPWKVTPELSVVIGWMFLGAAVYFSYSLIRPSWINSAGQLLGFLAYDLVLIVPFITRLPTTAPEFKLGLTIYTTVVSYSGLLALYYLFLHKPTRVRTWMRANRT